ncbi:MAG: ATP-dependent DNA helicase [Acidimicrobiales bacterium]
MVADIAQVLEEVTKTLPGGGEDRPGQLQMARAVADAISSGRHLVVRAGTGTGKSLAYLVPAVVSDARVVVATATKALQDQLAGKDLPAISRALGRPVSFAVLKGRANYLCLERAAEVGGRGVQQDLGTAVERSWAGDEGRLVEDVRRLLVWSHETATGDRADLDFEPHARAWDMMSVGTRECPGAHRCPEGSRCFAERARQRAAEADIVVVNTHLYGAHLASGGAVLPPHDVVVFDEAHELEDVMTQSLGVDLAPGRLRALGASARALLDDGETYGLEDVAERLRVLLAEHVGRRVLAAKGAAGGAHPARTDARPGGHDRHLFGVPTGGAEPASTNGTGPRLGTASGDEPSSTELSSVLELLRARLERLRSRLATEVGAGERAGRRTGDVGAKAGPAGDPAAMARALTAAAHLEGDLSRLLAPGETDVVWIDGSPRSPVLKLSPVDVGPVLAATLWSSVRSVLTSATLPAGIPARLRIDDFEVDHLDVGSPFDFRSHALLYVARHLPDPRHEGARAAMLEELGTLISAAGGRTLALFTSRQAAVEAASALAGRLAFSVLVQGDLPKSRLLEEFSGDETSCLFATLGFWQGVDVPGRALSLVTLDRLPFGRPGDPLLDARRERAGAAAFALVDLPRAAALLAQGVGRLIRSATDRGVVAVLDSRLATAGYRKVLLEALPPMRRTVNRDEVVGFLSQVLTEQAEG